MRAAAIKVIGAVALLALLAFAISITEHDYWLGTWFLLFIFAGLPLLILTTIDLRQELRDTQNTSRSLKILGLIIDIPGTLFSILSMLVGLSIICWIIWNTFIHREPEYTGGFLTFGMAPLIVLFGIRQLRRVFSRSRKRNGTKE